MYALFVLSEAGQVQCRRGKQRGNYAMRPLLARTGPQPMSELRLLSGGGADMAKGSRRFR